MSLVLLVTAVVAISWRSIAGSTPVVYVFVTVDSRAYTFEQELLKEMPDVEVHVFSRVREFESALQGQVPDAILARRYVLDSLGKRVELQGVRRGRGDEPFALLSLAAAVTPKELSGGALGVIGIVSRAKMPAFVSSLLDVPAPHLKYANSDRDLLALLEFGEVQAILLSAAGAERLRQSSQADLRLTLVKKSVGLPAVSFTSDVGRSMLRRKILALSASANSKLGVDQWQ